MFDSDVECSENRFASFASTGDRRMASFRDPVVRKEYFVTVGYYFNATRFNFCVLKYTVLQFLYGQIWFGGKILETPVRMIVKYLPSISPGVCCDLFR